MSPKFVERPILLVTMVALLSATADDSVIAGFVVAGAVVGAATVESATLPSPLSPPLPLSPLPLSPLPLSPLPLPLSSCVVIDADVVAGTHTQTFAH